MAEPNLIPLPNADPVLLRRLLDKADLDGDCLVWTGWRCRKGYGRVGNRKAHRVSWELFNGPIPQGLCVCHKCDNPPCVRPDHLFLGTVADNNADMWAKGRGTKPPAKRLPACQRCGSGFTVAKRGDRYCARCNGAGVRARRDRLREAAERGDPAGIRYMDLCREAHARRNERLKAARHARWAAAKAGRALDAPARSEAKR